MRRILTVFLLTAALCIWGSFSYAAELKMGYINLKKVLDEYERVAKGEDDLLKEAEQKGAQRDKMVNEIKTMREKIDLLGEKQKAQKEQELQKKMQELQEFTLQTRTDLRQKRDEKFIDIMKEIKDVIEEYAKSRNYELIIDDTLLLYKKESMDITDDVIKMLNKRYKR